MNFTFEINPSISLYDWQKECLCQWKNSDNHGIADVITGGGKTFFALCAVAEAARTSDRPLIVKIVLPKHSLIQQWKSSIRDFFKETPDIGEWHGSLKSKPSCTFMLYIINSARHSLPSHIIQAQKEGNSVFLIADECHHYASFENQKIFHFLNSQDFQRKYYYSLGLSATATEESRNLYLQRGLGNIIFHYNFHQASLENRIVPFYIYSTEITFTAEEAEQYDQLTAQLNRIMPLLKMEHPEIKVFTFEILRKLYIEDGSDSIAARVLNLTLRRREITLLASYRIPCTLRLLRELPETSRILIFCERIAQASELYRYIYSELTTRVSIYHSELSGEVRRTALESFRTGQSRILVSCRALDEGIDVPSADTGIILSSETTIRQHIQRLGRILRTAPDKEYASIYYLYTKNIEQSVYLPPISEKGKDSDIYTSCFLKYLGNDDLLIHPVYEDFCQRLLSSYKDQKDQSRYTELRKCLLEGRLRPDFLLSHKMLSLKISESTSQHKKNYYYAMLLLSELLQKDSPKNDPGY